MKTYKVIDAYEGHEDLIGWSDDEREILEMVKEYYEDTDGECELYLMRIDIPQEYRFIKTNNYKEIRKHILDLESL